MVMLFNVTNSSLPIPQIKQTITSTFSQLLWTAKSSFHHWVQQDLEYNLSNTLKETADSKINIVNKYKTDN